MATKKLPIKHVTIAGILYGLVFATAPEAISGSDRDQKCGGEKLWEVKVLRDLGADSLVRDKKLSSVKQLNLIDTEMKRYKENRLPFEKKIVTLKNVLIRKVIRENDNDYHLVIQDRNGVYHMIAEIPDPACSDARKSDYASDFKKVRKTMDQYGTSFMHYEFELTGVLFRDFDHNQTGAADNNLEIHPVLKLKATKTLNY